MGLQSPARLANSRNPNATNSNKTLQNVQNQGASGVPNQAILERDSSGQNSSSSPSNKQKGLFMFNNKSVNLNSISANRNNSPFFGASTGGKKDQQPVVAGSFADRASQMTQQIENS